MELDEIWTATRGVPNPLEAEGEERARRWAQNFLFNQDKGFEAIVKQAQLVDFAKGEMKNHQWDPHVFYKITDTRWDIFSGELAEVGDRIWRLYCELGGDGMPWLILYSLASPNFSDILKLGAKLRHQYNAESTIREIERDYRMRG